MTTVAALFGVSLVVRWTYLWLEWSAARDRSQMLRGVARYKLQLRKSRSRMPGGSTNSDVHDPQVSSGRIGVEPAATTRRSVAPPVPQALVGAVCPRAPHAHPTAPTRLPLSPAGAGGPGTPVPAPAGLHCEDAWRTRSASTFAPTVTVTTATTASVGSPTARTAATRVPPKTAPAGKA